MKKTTIVMERAIAEAPRYKAKLYNFFIDKQLIGTIEEATWYDENGNKAYYVNSLTLIDKNNCLTQYIQNFEDGVAKLFNHLRYKKP